MQAALLIGQQMPRQRLCRRSALALPMGKMPRQRLRPRSALALPMGQQMPRLRLCRRSALVARRAQVRICR